MDRSCKNCKHAYYVYGCEFACKYYDIGECNERKLNYFKPEAPSDLQPVLTLLADEKEINRLKKEVDYWKEACSRVQKKHEQEEAQLRAENNKLKQALENDFTYETTQGGKMNVLDLVRKQAVKEFAEKLKDNIVNKYDTDKFLNSYDYFLSMDTVDELLKEYGVN